MGSTLCRWPLTLRRDAVLFVPPRAGNSVNTLSGPDRRLQKQMLRTAAYLYKLPANISKKGPSTTKIEHLRIRTITIKQKALGDIVPISHEGHPEEEDEWNIWITKGPQRPHTLVLSIHEEEVAVCINLPYPIPALPRPLAPIWLPSPTKRWMPQI